jgi:hypothetical protein
VSERVKERSRDGEKVAKVTTKLGEHNIIQRILSALLLVPSLRLHTGISLHPNTFCANTGLKVASSPPTVAIIPLIDPHDDAPETAQSDETVLPAVWRLSTLPSGLFPVRNGDNCATDNVISFLASPSFSSSIQGRIEMCNGAFIAGKDAC